jgi:hypothetical protein
MIRTRCSIKKRALSTDGQILSALGVLRSAGKKCSSSPHDLAARGSSRFVAAYPIKKTVKDTLSKNRWSFSRPIVSSIYKEMADWTKVRKIVARPRVLTIVVRDKRAMGGRDVPTKMLLAMAAKKAPIPSPNRGSTWIGLMKKTMKAMATEANRAWKFLK